MTNYYTTARKGADAISDENKYKLLSNTRRRYVIEELYQDAPLTKSELADRLTERVTGHTSGAERKRIYISLHQQHIPRLMEHGIILEGDDGFVLSGKAGGLLVEMGLIEEQSEEGEENGGDVEPESSEEPERGGFRDRLGGLLKGSS